MAAIRKMAVDGNNRYALFVEEDENVTPPASPPSDPSQNPFLNQIADDSIPWQEVKKRDTSTGTLLTKSGNKMPGIKNTKAIPVEHVFVPSCYRAVSASTIDGVDRAPDARENWCGVCNQKFGNKASLQAHVKQLPEHQHYCNLCVRVFKDRNGIKNHVENSAGHDTFCNLCLSAFKDEWGLKNHFENNYQVGHEFVCLTCLLGFRSQVRLDRHLQTAEKHTWCASCHRRFRTQDERDDHWEKTKKHKHCLQPGCDFDTQDEAALVLHLKRDHFQCEGCKHILPSQTKLNLHYQSCSFTLMCPQCSQACAGKTQLALHLEQCHLCPECGFHTNHEGNYHIHMTKHTTTSIPCWACAVPMRTYSGLINHLEAGTCPRLPDPTLLLLCLGQWWYSPLYMDLDIHAQVRTGRINLAETQQWMDAGSLHPFVCRAEGCGKVFGHLSSLVLHCESQACKWDITRLNVPALEQEVRRVCVRRDSASG